MYGGFFLCNRFIRSNLYLFRRNILWVVIISVCILRSEETLYVWNEIFSQMNLILKSSKYFIITNPPGKYTLLKNK